MKSSYVFTRSQAEASSAFDDDTARRNDVLPSVEVTNQLRDLFLLLDPQGTGLVSRDKVVRTLFSTSDKDVPLPWKRVPHARCCQSESTENGRSCPTEGREEEKEDSGDRASLARSGVCVGWPSAPSQIDFYGLLQLYSSCLGTLSTGGSTFLESESQRRTTSGIPAAGGGVRASGMGSSVGEEQHPSTRLPAALSPLSRLSHATRSVHVRMSDAEVLRLADAFRRLDEGSKGFLDVLDVARGLVALATYALKQQRRHNSLAVGTGHRRWSRSSSSGFAALLAKISRAWLLEREEEHTIFLAMSQRMILAAVCGLEEAVACMGACDTPPLSETPAEDEHDAVRAQSVEDAFRDRPPVSFFSTLPAHVPSTGFATTIGATLGARNARIEHREATQSIPLIVSLPVFIRSYQCRTGAFPPQFLCFADACDPVVDPRDVPVAEGRIDTCASCHLIDKENHPDGTMMMSKKPATQGRLRPFAKGTLAPLSPGTPHQDLDDKRLPEMRATSTANDSRSASRLADSVRSGRRSVSSGGGGPPITTVSPFELALLSHLLSNYATRLCQGGNTVSRESGDQMATQPPAPPLAVRRHQGGCASDVDGKANGRADLGAAGPAKKRRSYVPHTVTRQRRNLSVCAVHESSSSSSLATASDDDEHSAAAGNLAASGDHGGTHGQGQSTAATLIASDKHYASSTLSAGTSSPSSLSCCAEMTPQWPEMAADGVPLVSLEELERHLLLDLDLIYSHLEEVRWVLVQRVCEVARTRAMCTYKNCEVVDLDVVLGYLATDPAGLGLGIQPHRQRLDACLSAVAESLPRSVVAFVVETMVELGMHLSPHRSTHVCSAEVVALEDIASGALRAIVTLQQRLPVVLAGSIDACGVVREGITRLFTSCAEPCVRSVNCASQVGAAPHSCCYLSMEALLTRLLADNHYATPPPRQHCLRGDTLHFDSYHCRRLSPQEMNTVLDVAILFLQTRKLMNASTPLPPYAEQPQLFRALSSCIVRDYPQLCAARPFVADSVASRLLCALPHLREKQRSLLSQSAPPSGPAKGAGHVAVGWERQYMHHLVFSASNNSDPHGTNGDMTAAPAADETSPSAWGEYAVGRTFCALGIEGCQQVSLCLCQVPLWPPTGVPSPPSADTPKGAVLAKEEDLIAFLNATVSRVTTVATATCDDAAREAVTAWLHHVVWDIVGACPRHTSRAARASVAIVDMTRVLRCFLEAFPVLSVLNPAILQPSFPWMDIYCRMTDVQSIYFALKRLIADSQPRARASTTSSPEAAAATSALSAVAANTIDAGAETVGGVTDGSVAKSNGSRRRHRLRQASPTSASRVPPVPFDRLRAILEADGLLYLLCSLGSQDAMTGEVTQLSQVLKALSLTEDCIRVSFSRLGRAPLPRSSRTSTKVQESACDTRSRVEALSEGLCMDAVIRARALALTMPCELQHAALQLFRSSATTDADYHLPQPCQVVDRHTLGSVVFRQLERAGRQVLDRQQEEELVALVDRLFLGAVADSGACERPHPAADVGSTVQRDGSLNSALLTLTLEKFVAAVFRERSAIVANQLAKKGCASGASSERCSAKLCALDILCMAFSPLTPSLLIE